MLRPMSLASSPAGGGDDPRRVALRGSTGLPVGGMGAIVDAIAASARAHGALLRTDARVARILHRGGTAIGAVTERGEEFLAPAVISTVPPRVAFGTLLDDDAVAPALRRAIADAPTPGAAFKLVLALDGLPRLGNLPPDVAPDEVAGTQFRVAESMDWIDEAVEDGRAGVPSRRPIIWGLIPTVTSPMLAPPGHHVFSANIWHAPYHLAAGDWAAERDRFGRRCIDLLARYMPDLPQRIVAQRFMGPRDIEAELGLVEANITHGDMLAPALFGARPHAACGGYRTPLAGFYLSGAGTWPGGYVSGLPGRNASEAVLEDLRRAAPLRTEATWSS
jgi:phytoene dehydrogenase-like protein